MTQEITLHFGLDEYGMLPADTSGSGEKNLRGPAFQSIGKPECASVRCIILKKSIDARKKNNIRITFRICLTDEPEQEYTAPAPASCSSSSVRPVVVGFGPAGMMAALQLAREGLCPIIIERGRTIENRIQDVETYFLTGQLNPRSNIQFGEGGAGTFSDGKLNTGVSDKRRTFVLETFVRAGAPPEIMYLSHPHVGTDRLRTVVSSIRKEILSLGGTIHFERVVTGIRVDNGILQGIFHAPAGNPGDESFLAAREAVLAVGHSARDTFTALLGQGIPMSAKPFSVGVRIEHPQEWVNRAQYGASAGHPSLPQADYKLVSHTSAGRALYTFCMCPGGFVVASSSEDGHVVTNGMSNYRRDGENANSAILVGVDTNDFDGRDILSGVRFQENLERLAFDAGGRNGCAPCQRLGDFLENRASVSCGRFKPTYRPGVSYTNIRSILPDFISATICEGVQDMNRKMPGFSDPDSLLTGIETRSSSPVRILRNDLLESPGASGLYPCGEGAGYAGGIMSSAIDGLRCAEKIIENRSI